MVTCHFNFQFQVLALLKGKKELGVVHFTMDAPIYSIVYEIRVFDTTFATVATCPLTLKMYKYMELQVYNATPKPSCKPSCKNLCFLKM